jgi:hypothetical protein
MVAGTNTTRRRRLVTWADGGAPTHDRRIMQREMRRRTWMEKKIKIEGRFAYMHDHLRVWNQVAQLKVWGVRFSFCEFGPK